MFFLETRQHHAKRKKDEEKRERKRRIAARMIAEYMVVKEVLWNDNFDLKQTVDRLIETNRALKATHACTDLENTRIDLGKAHMVISDYRHELAELMKDVVEYRETIKDLNEKNASLRARLSGEQETVYEQNDEIERLKGRVEGVGWAFEKVIQNK
jgi:predicted  nucleic acid-binding Zn-ribbon protein